MFSFLKKKKVLLSPMSGKVVDITELDDPVFSGKMVGDGVGIIPEDGEVLSPVDGEIVQMFETGHAVGIKSDDVEILIHVGMDTVEIKGEGFTKHVNVGDKVKAGDKLITADLELIKSHGKKIDTPVVITNGKEIKKVLGHAIKGKSEIIEVK